MKAPRRSAVLAVLLMVLGLLAGALIPGGSASAAPAPSVSALAAPSGPLKGGARVRVTGSGFVGVRRVYFGAALGTAVNVLSPSTLEVTTPARGAGVVPVKVVTAAGASLPSSSSRYTYVAPPAITGVSPASGGLAGGTAVLVTGMRFVGVTGVRFGARAATSWTLTSPTTLVAIAPPGASAGGIDVRVITHSGWSAPTPADVYTYAAPSPTLTSIAPDAGPLVGGGTVTISGAGFVGATSVTFGESPSAFEVVDDTTISATVPPAAAPGDFSVVVTSPSGASGAVTYTYLGAAPELGAVSPNIGPTAGGNRITISGSGFRDVQGVVFDDLEASEVTVESPTRLSALAPPHAAGPVTVRVRTAYGESGPSTYTYADVPPARALATGSHHSCLLDEDGGVRCWGWNAHGQLGDGSTTSRSVPVPVLGLESGVQAIAAGGATTCALRADATVLCWGWNAFGQLGVGDSLDRTSPEPVLGLGAARAISVGSGHSCAILLSGAVACWGWNYSGQLGTGDRADAAAPTAVVGLVEAVSAIAAGDEHTCAVTQAGSVWCWGAGQMGQLGDGARGESSLPRPVPAMSGEVTALTAGVMFTCAVRSGQSWCWGRNAAGQLGDGTRDERAVPVAVAGLSAASGITAGGSTCALAGVAYCWGANTFGRLGDGTDTSRTLPVAVIGLPPGVAALSAGAEHACALTQGGALFCWGANSQGQLGDGTLAPRLSAVRVGG